MGVYSTCAARHHDGRRHQAIFKMTDDDAHASTSTLASLQVDTCGWHLECTGSDQNNILPPRLDGSAASAIDIQHPASRRGCTGGGGGRRHGGLDKALSAVFVSRTLRSWKLAHVHVEPAHVQINPASRASPKRNECTPQVKGIAAIPATVTRSAEDNRLWHEERSPREPWRRTAAPGDTRLL